MTAFILEQFRFFLTSYSTVDRTVVKDFKIGNITIYKGTHILAFLCGPYHTEENYENPLTFDIYRHSEETLNNMGNRSTLYPFSIGLRACPGRYVAMFNIQIGMISMLKNFEIK
jgi:cytochrome P450